MPVETGNGGTCVTGNAILGLRAVMTIQAIRFHLESGGKMRLTRFATPSNLRAIASEFTGRTYARSTKGLRQALADLEAMQAGKSLDEIGDTHKVEAVIRETR